MVEKFLQVGLEPVPMPITQNQIVFFTIGDNYIRIRVAGRCETMPDACRASAPLDDKRL
jgi:hypothetical protein